MPDLSFELEPFEDDPQRGYRGTAGSYGDVMAFHTRQANHPQAMYRAQLVSDHLPDALVAGMGIMGQPSTQKATLQVDGKAGKLKYNSFGLTRAARALHITYADRKYTYMYTKNFRSDVELRRTGASVAINAGKLVRKVGRLHEVSATGNYDETDLAIALVFEAVAVFSLAPEVAAFHAVGVSRANSPNNGEAWE